MIRKTTILGGVMCAAFVAACSSSSNTTSTTKDAGEEKDTGKPGTDAGTSPHVLVTYNGTTSKTTPSTMVAVNLATKRIDGKLSVADSEAITDTSNASAPFILEQTLDVASRIDPATWTTKGSWNIPGPPGDAGASADPYAISVTAGSQLFVISYGSNDISVFNTTTSSTTPSAVVHLETLLQPGDMDGFVDAAAAAYDPTSQLLYVVLGNVNTAATYTYMDSPYTLCGATKSSVIAIDVTTASVVSLQGTAPGGGIALQGYDPSGPTGLVYDAAGSRLLVFEAGCNAPPAGDAGNTGDAGAPPGPLKLRGVEEVNLTTKTSSILLDASTQGFPGSLIYIDSTHAVVGFSFPSSTFSWDPTSTTLGAALPNAPATFDYDGKGNLVGATLAYGDSGTPTTDIVSMALSNGTVTTLQSNVVELGMYGYAASVGVWPRP